MLLVTWAVILGAATAAAFWGFVVIRLARVLPRIPAARDGLDYEPADGWPHVTVIVPAHNEERVIERCAESILASDYPALDAVIVLDRCSDRTLEVLRPIAERDRRITVVENTSCPPDWAGKCNAARVGSERARGSLLLFTDADVRFDPLLIRAAVGCMRKGNRDLLSVLPRLVHESWYEWIVQPVAGMTLMRMYPIDRVNRGDRSRPFANGAFLLFTREAYERVGGHAATKDDLLEDLAFARIVSDAGGSVGVAMAEDLLVVHMYPTFQAMRVGWKRIFIEACKRKVGRLRFNALRVFAVGVLWLLVQVAAVACGLSVGGWIGAIAVAVVLIGLALQGIALGLIYGKAAAPLLGAIGFPVGSLYVALALWDGAADLVARRPVRWGGREYVLTPR